MGQTKCIMDNWKIENRQNNLVLCYDRYFDAFVVIMELKLRPSSPLIQEMRLEDEGRRAT